MRNVWWDIRAWFWRRLGDAFERIAQNSINALAYCNRRTMQIVEEMKAP